MRIISCHDPKKPVCETCPNFEQAISPTRALFSAGLNGLTNGSSDGLESEYRESVSAADSGTHRAFL